MGRRLLLFCNLSWPLMPARPSKPFLYSPIKGYNQYNTQSHGQGVEERAPSLADEFRRVAEEKAKAQETTHVVDQGGASQTAEKTSDGLEEASSGDGDIQSVQERYKEHEPGADYRRRG
ncbi:hypothetical protein P3X46_006593 [Hevea brasiliensis]|uniref:Uncharacterized protein n=1 Tax=Hevea brasiliensis TaxID=3981 RepID=A0ABQ9MQQ0_HEVBR|nr:uncharacterized protein LOC110669958 [Hevea brasiliensis]KAJ9182617.1 hypothetical protein P3X46_006593 [Hevea brasiliensis]